MRIALEYQLDWIYSVYQIDIQRYVIAMPYIEQGRLYDSISRFVGQGQ